MIQPKKNGNKLKIIPLGGLGEIGKNLTVFEYGRDMIVVDCGLAFPNYDMLGVDYVIPDMSYIESKMDRLRAIIITHGHEDHIGSLPYLLKKVKAPIYGTRLTLGLIENKLIEHPSVGDVKYKKIAAGDTVSIGCFKIEFIKVSHSIAGVVALAIHTPAGTVVHTADFKIDYTPLDGAPIDLGKFAKLGEEGVMLLMSDSTNATRPGYTMTERMVGATFEKYFRMAKGRIIVATFASNIHRVEQIIQMATMFGRKVYLQGRSMVNVAEVAMRLGEMKIKKNTLVDVEQIKRLPDEKVCIITTGSQGEAMSGLVRMASDTLHSRLNVEAGDTVILSSSPIPGNEKYVSNVINQLFKKGAIVVDHGSEAVHVSGHACQEELKIILQLTKPKYFMPIHGEYRHLKTHGLIAEELGVSHDNIFFPEIGEVLELNSESAKITGTVPSGNIMIDGSGIGDVGNIVLRDRRLLSQDGLFVVVVAVSKVDSTYISGPEIVSRGFVYVRESEKLIIDAKELVRKELTENKPRAKDFAAMKNTIRGALKDYLYQQTGRNPLIMPIIVEV